MRPDRWVFEWFTGEKWTEIATGRSRIRACAVFTIGSMARPDATHRLRWKQEAVPMNTKVYGLITGGSDRDGR